jgi:hypothetical protein
MPTIHTQLTLDVVVQYAIEPAENGFPEQVDITKVQPIGGSGRNSANLLRFMDESQIINLEDEILSERNQS